MGLVTLVSARSNGSDAVERRKQQRNLVEKVKEETVAAAARGTWSCQECRSSGAAGVADGDTRSR
uniref:Uncharacterized protein n=1 Tax=Peronospora matthiolae TaxID=2874970 RepID=A0AAV1TXX9_9STRA